MRNVDEFADQSSRAGEIDDAVVVGAAGELVARSCGRTLDEHALARPDHAVADRLALRVDFCLQSRAGARA